MLSEVPLTPVVLWIGTTLTNIFLPVTGAPNLLEYMVKMLAPVAVAAGKVPIKR